MPAMSSTERICLAALKRMLLPWAQGPGPATTSTLPPVDPRPSPASDGCRASADAAHVVHDQSVAQADSDDGGPGSHNEGGSDGESDDPGSGGISGEPGRSE